jgi:hypothetical protein
MFLFYTLMCRNYQEYKWKPCWSQIGTFQKSVPKRFSKMVMLRVEDCIKQKTLKLQSCRKFHGERSGHKIHLIPTPDDGEKPAPLWLKMGRWESERLYKGRNRQSYTPLIAARPARAAQASQPCVPGGPGPLANFVQI